MVNIDGNTVVTRLTGLCRGEGDVSEYLGIRTTDSKLHGTGNMKIWSLTAKL